MTTDKEIIEFLNSAGQNTTLEEYEQRLQDDLFRHFNSEEDGTAFMLANRLLLIGSPIGIRMGTVAMALASQEDEPPSWCTIKDQRTVLAVLASRYNVEGEVSYARFGRPPNNADLVMPWFYFERLPHIEQEAGFALPEHYTSIFLSVSGRRRRTATYRKKSGTSSKHCARKPRTAAWMETTRFARVGATGGSHPMATKLPTTWN